MAWWHQPRSHYLAMNTSRLRQNCRHFADDIFKCIFLNERVWILLKISLKFVPKARINNIPALVQIMAWRRTGDKPLSEPLLVSLWAPIYITRPQWVNHVSWCHMVSLGHNKWTYISCESCVELCALKNSLIYIFFVLKYKLDVGCRSCS